MSGLILELDVESGKHPSEIKIGTHIFFGQDYLKCPSQIARCGHVISKKDDKVKIYISGFKKNSNEFINLYNLHKENAKIKIFNNKKLYLMDDETINYLKNINHIVY